MTPIALTDQQRALKLWVILARAHAAVAEHTRRDIARHELTEAEFAILEVLYHRGPMVLCDVQRKILVSSGGITYLVDRLQGRGLVERRECPEDRRARYAALTAEGEALMGWIFPAHAEAVERAVSGVSPEEQETLISLLRTLGRSAAERSV